MIGINLDCIFKMIMQFPFIGPYGEETISILFAIPVLNISSGRIRMPKSWEHFWITSGKSRHCSKCGVVQTKIRTTGGRLAVGLGNPIWEPTVRKKCDGDKNE
jgi:hypothetical protein